MGFARPGCPCEPAALSLHDYRISGAVAAAPDGGNVCLQVPYVPYKFVEKNMDALAALAKEPLDLDSKTPLYQQLEERILQLIVMGAFDETTPLPTETSICEVLGLSRATVRRCFEDLVDNGHVVRRRGRGTFVQSQGRDGYMGSINFASEMRSLGREPSSRIVGFREVPASGMLADRLEVTPGTPLWESRRIRLADGHPVQIDITVFPKEVCPELTRDDLKGSLYQKIALSTGKMPARRLETYEAVVLDAGEARLLEQPAGSAALRRICTTYDASGKPYEACICVEAAAVAQLVVDMDSTTARVSRRYL